MAPAISALLLLLLPAENIMEGFLVAIPRRHLWLPLPLLLALLFKAIQVEKLDGRRPVVVFLHDYQRLVHLVFEV